jgi:hypothetical protein
VCFVDPTVMPAGVEFVTPRRDATTGNVVIERQGRTIRVDEPAPSTNQPVTALRIRTGRGALEFTPYGGARPITEDIVFLGYVDNTPVYARESSLRTLAQRTGELQRERTLNEWLQRDAANVRAFETEVMELYVPSENVGCVFTTYQQMERVIKR